ncbi:hypothetical protein PR003_g25023 [Phytophthora rubi]|uniref:Uncharacterized protein n=1 Tax=Phytophthora rubi TaxID=129364 RepID=A0A6A4CHW8_9STRA|nr:hypothetical protein PR003_g25023 [Phytophthora rubi]
MLHIFFEKSCDAGPALPCRLQCLAVPFRIVARRVGQLRQRVGCPVVFAVLECPTSHAHRIRTPAHFPVVPLGVPRPGLPPGNVLSKRIRMVPKDVYWLPVLRAAPT